MTQVSEGVTVKVHYTGKLEDGTVFDSSRERDPIEFTVGQNQVIPGFESAVAGMKPGQTKTEIIPPEKAYGPRRDELVMEVQKAQFPEDVKPTVGQALKVRSPDGSAAEVTVAEVKDETVMLDANHPLAGKNLVFEIEVIEVKK